jgi:threonine/homoserine/homoserine lactone efflux protein
MTARAIDIGIMLQFAAGYVAVLAVPGPNMLAIGAIASLRGLAGALPAVLGLAAGALLLAIGIHLLMAQGVGLGAPIDRIVPALMLAGAALWVARLRPPCVAATAAPGRPLLLFSGACAIAASNPITGAYLAASMLGGAGSGGGLALALIAPLLTGSVMLVVAALFSRAAVREVAAAWHRPIRWCAAGLLGAFALAMLLPAARP